MLSETLVKTDRLFTQNTIFELTPIDKKVVLEIISRLDPYHYLRDERPKLSQLYEKFFATFNPQRGWSTDIVYWQEFTVSDMEIRLPVVVFRNSHQPKRLAAAVIHGREVAPVSALFNRCEQISKTEIPAWVAPCLNVYGYASGKRYSPNNKSVGDMEHRLGLPDRDSPACPEAEALACYLENIIPDGNEVIFLGLHEDIVTEDLATPDEIDSQPDNVFYQLDSLKAVQSRYVDGNGTYLYITGRTAKEHPLTPKMIHLFNSSNTNILRNWQTRFGEQTDENGVVWFAKDGSVEHFLAELLEIDAAYTFETIALTPATPPLTKRAELQTGPLDLFFDLAN